jgi:hypothetical protein
MAFCIRAIIAARLAATGCQQIDSVIDEIIKTPSVDYCEVESKVAAAKLLVENPDDGQWAAQIAAIGASIRRDMVRLDGRDVVIAALAA